MSAPEDQDDRRVGELLRDKQGTGSAEELDSATIASLEAWFAEPAADLPPPASRRPAPPTGKPGSPDEARRKRREQALAAVSPVLLERLESQGRHAAALVEPAPPPASTLDRSISRFDFAFWGLQGIGEPREYQRSDDVASAVRERTPQAILRDLHRPVLDFGKVYLRPVDLGIDRSGERTRASIADLVYRRRYRVDVDREPSGRRFLREGQAELQAILDQPWEDSKPANPRPVSSDFPDANDMRWFGSVGIDPDQ